MSCEALYLTCPSLKVQAIQRFTSTATAVEDLAAIQDGRLTESLEKFIVEATGGASEGDKKKKKKVEELLVVSEPKLGTCRGRSSQPNNTDACQLPPSASRSRSLSFPTAPPRSSTVVSASSSRRSSAVSTRRT